VHLFGFYPILWLMMHGTMNVKPYSFFNLGTRWEWVVKTTAWPLYPQERPGNHCIGGWMEPRASIEGCGKSRPSTGIRTTDRWGRSKSLYQLSYLCDLEGGRKYKMLRRENGIKLLQIDTKRFTRTFATKQSWTKLCYELPYEQKHKKQIQFWAPDDERYAARNMLSIQ
jgi:hypothetical protein